MNKKVNHNPFSHWSCMILFHIMSPVQVKLFTFHQECLENVKESLFYIFKISDRDKLAKNKIFGKT